MKNINKYYKYAFAALVVILLATYLIMRKSPTTTPNETEKLPSLAVWVWDNPSSLTGKKLDELLDFSQENNISTIYLNIEEYINIYESKDKNFDNFDKSIDDILRKTNEKNIKVHALSGSADWHLDSHSYIPPIMLDYVNDYNRTHEVKFDGFQFDIEFYNQEEFKGNEAEQTKMFLDLIESFQQKAPNNFGLAIPYWLSDREYTGKSLQTELFEILSEFESPYVAVMAYRNKADGKNGTIEISENILEETQNDFPNINVIIGQETTKIDEKNATYFGMPKSQFTAELLKIDEKYKAYNSYKGIAVHDIKGFREMK
jgi:hypothetical protein